MQVNEMIGAFDRRPGFTELEVARAIGVVMVRLVDDARLQGGKRMLDQCLLSAVMFLHASLSQAGSMNSGMALWTLACTFTRARLTHACCSDSGDTGAEAASEEPVEGEEGGRAVTGDGIYFPRQRGLTSGCNAFLSMSGACCHIVPRTASLSAVIRQRVRITAYCRSRLPEAEHSIINDPSVNLQFLVRLQ